MAAAPGTMKAFVQQAKAGLACLKTRYRDVALLGTGVLAAAMCGNQVLAETAGTPAGSLPVDKLACHRDVAAPRTPVVLVSCGSFNPPTVMHLRMFDLAVAALAQRGYDVWGCYMSPVADAYGKQDLVPVHHRLSMCQLAAADTSNVMVDDWEASRPGYTRTLQVLRHVRDCLAEYLMDPDLSSPQGQAEAARAAGLGAAATTLGETSPPPSSSSSSSDTGPASSSSSSSPNTNTSAAVMPAPPAKPAAAVTSTSGAADAAAAAAAAAGAAATARVPRVMLLGGADLVATMTQPGLWVDPDLILGEHGVVVVCREGTDLSTLLEEPGSLLNRFKTNIIVVPEPVQNGVSSTKLRELLAAGQPVRFLMPDAVIAYIKAHWLYGTQAAQAAGGM